MPVQPNLAHRWEETVEEVFGSRLRVMENQCGEVAAD